MTATTEMIGRLTTAESALKFILAGDAYFTVRSAKTGTRFTFRVSLAKRTEQNNFRKLWFVSYLGGPDNTSDYFYMGVIRDNVFRLTPKSKVNEVAPVVTAFRWVIERLIRNDFPAQVEIWHEGRCGVCGRALTVPESIASGIGPVCAGRAA